MSAALGYRWDGKHTRLFFQVVDGNYDTTRLIGFLDGLRREMRGQKVILIWDGLPAHKSREMKAYLHAQRRWLTTEMLPGYAPDLNPVELLWGNVKGKELANLCADHLAGARSALLQGLRRVRRSASLAFSFLQHTGLSSWAHS